ncbi:hypothetical protein DFP72DRAFT_89531 [Ephemerocybe angulata]|uniref:G domain-containing protein n=1 Tax=Ephemerocybe angulata TaxID=980116 RepID=A0A8H6HBQ7_9AGAR|nr:hypothetical protein DFP72DRAFT_89531 [Tulosesus angulatus]
MGSQQDEGLLVAIMGDTGAGKSSFINKLLGRTAAPFSDGMYSCTRGVDEYTCGGFPNGRSVTLVDTPGFNDCAEHDKKSDAEILEMVADFLKEQYEQNRKLSGVVLLHAINGEGPATSKNMRRFRAICGNDRLSNVVVATTRWDEACETEEGFAYAVEYEQLLMDSDGLLKDLNDANVPFYRTGHFDEEVPQPEGDQYRSPRAIVESLLHLEPVFLKIQEEMAEGKTVQETDAGLLLQQEFAELKHDLNGRMDLIQTTMESLQNASELGKVEWEEKNAALQERVKEWKRLQREFTSQWKTWEDSQKSMIATELELLKANQAKDIEDVRSALQEAQNNSRKEGQSLSLLNAELKTALDLSRKERSDLSIECQALRVREQQLADQLNEARVTLTQKTLDLHADKVKLLEDLNEARSALTQARAEMDILSKDPGIVDVMALRAQLENVMKDRDHAKALRLESDLELERIRAVLRESRAELERKEAQVKAQAEQLATHRPQEPSPNKRQVSTKPVNRPNTNGYTPGLDSLSRPYSRNSSEVRRRAATPTTSISPPPPYSGNPTEELANARRRVRTLRVDLSPEFVNEDTPVSEADHEFLNLINERIPQLEKLIRDQRGTVLRSGTPRASVWPGF